MMPGPVEISRVIHGQGSFRTAELHRIVIPGIHLGNGGMVPNQRGSQFDVVGVEIRVGNVHVFAGIIVNGVGDIVAHAHVDTAFSRHRGGADHHAGPDEFVVGGGGSAGRDDLHRGVADKVDGVKEAGDSAQEGVGCELGLVGGIIVGIGMPGIQGFSGNGVQVDAGKTLVVLGTGDLVVVDHVAGSVHIGVKHPAGGGGLAATMIGHEIAASGDIGYHPEGHAIVSSDHVVVIIGDDGAWGFGECVQGHVPLFFHLPAHGAGQRFWLRAGDHGLSQREGWQEGQDQDEHTNTVHGFLHILVGFRLLSRLRFSRERSTYSIIFPLTKLDPNIRNRVN